MSSRVVQHKKDWKANPVERYFLFTDGSFRTGVRDFNYVNIVGMGAEMRDKEGKKVLFYSEEKILKVTEKPEKNCEIITLENALDIVTSLGVRNLVLQTDMQGMAKVINEFIDVLAKQDNKLLNHTYNTCKKDWLTLFKKVASFNEVFIEYIPRHLNENADYYSRSALELDREKLIQKQKLGMFESAMKVLKAKESLFDEMFSPVGVVSLFPVDLNSLYVFQAAIFSDKNLFIEVLDDKTNQSFSVKVTTRCDKKVLIKPSYYPVNLRYQENKELALLFLLMSLVTEKSSLKLLVEMSRDGERPDVNYSHNLWSTFTDIKCVRDLFALDKKSFYLNDELKELLNNALKKRFNDVMDDDCHKEFMRVMHTHKKVAPLNLFDCRVLWKKSAMRPDGEAFPKGWFFISHKEKVSQPVKVNPPQKKKEDVKPAFSFLAYGQSLRENQNSF